MHVRFATAVDTALAHRRDRSMLVELHGADGPLPYEKLHERVGGPVTQGFQRSLDRLISRALVHQRLELLGGSYRSRLGLTERGMRIAEILISLGRTGQLPRDLDEHTRKTLQGTFLGRAPTPEAPAKRDALVLSGPDAWRDDAQDPGRSLGRGLPRDRTETFTPRDLREALAARIEAADPNRPVHVAGAEQIGTRSEADRGPVSDRFLIVPAKAEGMGVSSVQEDLSAEEAGAPAEGEAHPSPRGQAPVILFLEHGFTQWTGPGRYTLVEGTERAQALEALARKAAHVQFWDSFEQLSDAVIEWALR